MDQYKKIKELHNLKEKGILTEEEFTEEKRKILGAENAKGYETSKLANKLPISPRPNIEDAKVAKNKYLLETSTVVEEFRHENILKKLNKNTYSKNKGSNNPNSDGINVQGESYKKTEAHFPLLDKLSPIPSEIDSTESISKIKSVSFRDLQITDTKEIPKLLTGRFDQTENIQEIPKRNEYETKNNARQNVPLAWTLGGFLITVIIVLMNIKHNPVADNKVADEIFVKKCVGGDGYECNKLGLMYKEGTGVYINMEKALKYFSNSCYYNESEGCKNVALAYEYGYGVEKVPVNAFKFYEKACELENAEGCKQLGWCYEVGFGTKKSHLGAKKHYRRACELSPSDPHYREICKKYDLSPFEIQDDEIQEVNLAPRTIEESEILEVSPATSEYQD